MLVLLFFFFLFYLTDYDDMVECSNESCPTVWYHLKCAKLFGVPFGDWLCDECIDEIEVEHRVFHRDIH